MQKAYLQQIREIQGHTGPNMCLASCKFLALKLLGLVDPTKHLSDFLSSRWAHRNSGLPLHGCWGGSIADHNDTFNRSVLPAAVNDPSAGVKSSSTRGIRFHKGFTHFLGQHAKADRMLRQLTPLIVGVSIHGGTTRDHFIVIFKDALDRFWAVDPWPGDPNEAVCELDTFQTFTRPIELHMTADAVKTRIPCGIPFFGYFE